MPLTDGAVIIPGVGYVYTAPTNTEKPADPKNPGATWTDRGHTSEDGLSVSFEISKSLRRTWRARAGLRESIDEVSFVLSWTSLQIDNPNMGAFFGGGDIAGEGVFGVPKTPGSVEKALFIRLVDGAAEVDVYAAKVSLGPNGEITASPEGFAGLPIAATVLDDAAAAHLAEWLSPHLGTPAGGALAPSSTTARKD